MMSTEDRETEFVSIGKPQPSFWERARWHAVALWNWRWNADFIEGAIRAMQEAESTRDHALRQVQQLEAEVENLREQLAAERHLDREALHVPQTSTSGVNTIIGKWPGDETDEEIAEALHDLDPGESATLKHAEQKQHPWTRRKGIDRDVRMACRQAAQGGMRAESEEEYVRTAKSVRAQVDLTPLPEVPDA